MLWVNVRIGFEAKREEVIVKKMRETRKGAGRKEVKMPRVEFDLKAIKEIKKRKKKMTKKEVS